MKLQKNIRSRFLAMGMAVLLLIAVLPTMSVSAALSLKNGGFEKDGDWYRDKGDWGKEFTYVNDAHSGNRALRIKGFQSLYVRCAATKMNPGAVITFRGFYKVNSLPSSSCYPAIKIEFFDADKNALPESGNFVAEYKNPEIKTWVEVTETIQSPADAGYMRILVRLINGGDILWDDLALTSVGGEGAEVLNVPFAEALPGEENRITDNPGFEEGLTWMTSSYGELSVVEDAERGNVLKIVSKDGTNPWALCSVPVKEGETYQVSAWLKTESVWGEGPAFKIECYSMKGGEAVISGADVWCPYYESTGGEWKRVWTQFMVNGDTDVIKLYVRLYGEGVVYYDDVECVKIKEPAYKWSLIPTCSTIRNGTKVMRTSVQIIPPTARWILRSMTAKRCWIKKAFLLILRRNTVFRFIFLQKKQKGIK